MTAKACGARRVPRRVEGDGQRRIARCRGLARRGAEQLVLVISDAAPRAPQHAVRRRQPLERWPFDLHGQQRRDRDRADRHREHRDRQHEQQDERDDRQRKPPFTPTAGIVENRILGHWRHSGARHARRSMARSRRQNDKPFMLTTPIASPIRLRATITRPLQHDAVERLAPPRQGDCPFSLRSAIQRLKRSKSCCPASRPLPAPDARPPRPPARRSGRSRDGSRPIAASHRAARSPPAVPRA